MAAAEEGAAAVGNLLLASTYGLNVLAKNIEDRADNITRFLVIAKHGAEPSEKNKTSLLMLVEHRPGALNRTLEALARREITMRRIASRHVKTKNREYLILVDLEGHERDSRVYEAIKGLEKHCIVLQRLGSYPAGGEPWD